MVIGSLRLNSGITRKVIRNTPKDKLETALKGAFNLFRNKWLKRAQENPAMVSSARRRSRKISVSQQSSPHVRDPDGPEQKADQRAQARDQLPECQDPRFLWFFQWQYNSTDESGPDENDVIDPASDNGQDGRRIVWHARPPTYRTDEVSFHLRTCNMLSHRFPCRWKHTVRN